MVLDTAKHSFPVSQSCTSSSSSHHDFFTAICSPALVLPGQQSIAVASEKYCHPSLGAQRGRDAPAQASKFQCGRRLTWVSLVAQLVKNPPAVQETWVRSLGWEDPLRREWQPTPGFLPGESHGQRSLAGCSPRGHNHEMMSHVLARAC